MYGTKDCTYWTGGGMKLVEMDFLPRASVARFAKPCKGKRYNRETFGGYALSNRFSDVLPAIIDWPSLGGKR